MLTNLVFSISEVNLKMYFCYQKLQNLEMSLLVASSQPPLWDLDSQPIKGRETMSNEEAERKKSKTG